MRFKKGLKVKIKDFEQICKDLSVCTQEYLNFHKQIAGKIVTLSRVSKDPVFKWGPPAKFEIAGITRPKDRPNWWFDLLTIEHIHQNPIFDKGIVVYLEGIAVGEVYPLTPENCEDIHFELPPSPENYGYFVYIQDFGAEGCTIEEGKKWIIIDHTAELNRIKAKIKSLRKVVYRYT